MESFKIPKKNIQPVLADIRHPKKILAESKEKSLDWGIGPSRKERFVKSVAITFILFLLVGLLFLGFQFFNLKYQLTTSGQAIYSSFLDIAGYLKSLETERASNSLSDVSGKLENLDEQFKFFNFIPILKEVPETFAKLQELTNILKSASENLAKLESGGLGLLFGEGEGALPILQNIDANLKSLEELSVDLRNRLVKFGGLPPDFDANYLSLSSSLARLREGLSGLISLLGSSENKHLLVIFENPSEIRPAGGFVGSYADLTFYQGKIQEIDVNDIYYPDKFLKLKVVPPLQLQGMTVGWGARDANWFFDFPASARKIQEFIEASPIYSDRNIKFEGVLAINVRVIEDLLKLTGPIELKQYKLTLDENNFLKQVQYEVEAGRDKQPGQNPKRILKTITPILIERLKTLDSDGKKKLLESLAYRVQNKDIMAYFKDSKLQNFILGFGMGGEIFSLPSRFSGDYLAIVNANVGGGKSDAFMKETITLNSKIMNSGSLSNNLKIVRQHKGNKEKESWYRATNQNFMKVFLPSNSHLEVISGNSEKVIKPLINYAKSGYSIDNDLKIIEYSREVLKKFNIDSFLESGKKVFAAWFIVPAGTSKELGLTYSEESSITPGGGTKFQFILDKQSGVEARFEYTIEAPDGFKFSESNSPVFHYESESLPGRLIIDLTLKSNGS